MAAAIADPARDRFAVLRRARLLSRGLPALLPVAAFTAAGGMLASAQPAMTSAETAYLTLLGGWVLGSAALLSPQRGRSTLAAALLATLALWMLPAGVLRGTAITLVLVGGVMANGWECLQVRARLGLLATTGGAVAVHGLLRAGELLPAMLPGSALGRELLPPVLAGMALGALARRRARAEVLTIGLATALAAGGFTATAALPLLLLAAADRLGRDRPTALHELPLAGASPDGPATGRVRRNRAVTSLSPLAGLLVLAALPLGLMRPVAGMLAVAAGAARLLPARWAWLPAFTVTVAALVTGADPSRALASWPILVLLPTVLLVRTDHRARALAGILLAAAGSLWLPMPAGAAAALALLALDLREDAPLAPLQRGWLAFLLALGALAGGYPWLRGEPLLAACALLGLDRGWVAAGVVLAAMALLAASARLIAAAWLPLPFAGCLALALVAAMQPSGRDLLPAGGFTLDRTATLWTATPSTPVRRVRIVSALANAGELSRGTAVATLQLVRGAQVVARWPLRVGEETGEWAAARADLRDRTIGATPWWSWVAPDGRFFAHAYGAHFVAASASSPVTLRLERSTALPPDVTLSLLQVEASP